MRSATAAEWLLSLVAAPDRAASTVGDLVEEASSRGMLWFWSSLLRTGCSHFWRGLCASPQGMVGLAFWGFLENLVLGVLLGMFVGMVRVRIFDSVPHWEHSLALVLVVIAVPFLVGWEVADRSDGRELPAAFALAFLFAAFGVVSLYLWPGVERTLTLSCARALSVIAGAILFRQRTLAKQKSPC